MTIYLKHVEGSGAGRTDVFAGGRIRIGRQPDNDLRADPTNEREVSGYHAEIYQQGHTFFVRDLQSRNGTYLNAQRIEGDVPLNDGDAIQFSSHGPKIIFSTQDPSRASETLPPGYAASAPHAEASDWRSGTGGSPNLVSRVKNILLRPQEEWRQIAAETTSVRDLYLGYIGPLAIIGPIASVIGMSLIGVTIPALGTYRVPLLTAMVNAVVSFVLTLVGVFVFALIINALAPSFSGAKDQMQSLKVAAYALTPAFLAGILNLLPMLFLLGLLAALYGLYLLYLGLPVLMRSPQEKALGYTIVVVLCGIVLGFIIGGVSMALVRFPTARLGIGAVGMALAGRAGGPSFTALACGREVKAEAERTVGFPDCAERGRLGECAYAPAVAGGLDEIGSRSDWAALEELQTLAMRLAGPV